jgi:diguanylate cyclase (GGDEF)-like protein
MRTLLSFNMSKEDESLFRQHYLRAETWQATFGLLILMVPLLAFIYNDYKFFGTGTEFWCFVALRAFMLAATIATVILLWRSRDFSVHDWLMTIWMVGGLVAITVIDYTRPANFIGHAIIDVVILLIVYLVIPNRIVTQTIIALIFTAAGVIIMLLQKELTDDLTMYTVLFSVLVANTAGFAGSWQLNLLRRREFRAQIEEGLARDDLKRLAEIDDLTGIYNSRVFQRMCVDEIARFQRYGRPLSFIMLDLDHFKLVNDNYGHMMGDKVLRQVAGTVSKQLREVDIMGRMGGEEFGILLPETMLDDARIVAERVLDALRRLDITADSGARLNITASLGLAEAVSSDTGMDSLTARADKALYKAKKNGRDRVETA